MVETSKDGRSAYGGYAQLGATIFDAISITSTSNNESTAYGTYLDNGKIHYSGYASSSIIAKNTSDTGSAYGIYAINEANIYTYSLNNSAVSISAESNAIAYGVYVDNSTLKTGSNMNIDVQANTLAYGVYISNSTNDANLSGTYSVYAKNGKSVGISINNSEISKITANVYTKSENVVNSEAVGIEINSANSDINITGNVSVSVNGEVNSTHNGIGYTGVLIENAKNVKIDSTITLDTTSTGASKQALYNMRAVETKTSNEITFDKAILTTYNNKGVAIKSTGTDLTIAGNATFNGDIVAGMYSFKVGDPSDKYNINVNSGSFVINSPKIYADVLKLGSAETSIAEFNLAGRQTEFDVNTIVFYAESLTSYSKINVNETEVLASDKFNVQIEFAEDFTFNAGDTLVLFEVDSPNTITISALESKEAIISVGNTILEVNCLHGNNLKQAIKLDLV